MVKKFLIAGAGAATVFGLTAAGASSISFPALGQGTNESHILQQSDQVSTTCTTAPVRMATDVNDASLVSVAIKADDIANCASAEFQAVAYDAAGNVLGKTTIVRPGMTPVPNYHPQWGQDLTLNFPTPPLASSVAKLRLTIADNILG